MSRARETTGGHTMTGTIGIGRGSHDAKVIGFALERLSALMGEPLNTVGCQARQMTSPEHVEALAAWFAFHDAGAATRGAGTVRAIPAPAGSHLDELTALTKWADRLSAALRGLAERADGDSGEVHEAALALADGIHEAIREQAGPPEMPEPRPGLFLTLAVAGLTDGTECPECGAAFHQWDITAHAGRLSVTCPACHLPIGQMRAIAAS